MEFYDLYAIEIFHMRWCDVHCTPMVCSGEIKFRSKLLILDYYEIPSELCAFTILWAFAYLSINKHFIVCQKQKAKVLKHPDQTKSTTNKSHVD